MKIKSIYQSMENFAEKLGDKDLTVSIAICEGKYYISVSCHSSKMFKFDHNGLQRTAEITDDDLNRNVNTLLGELVNKYKKHLIRRESENVT